MKNSEVYLKSRECCINDFIVITPVHYFKDLIADLGILELGRFPRDFYRYWYKAF
jgi:hypothetical protein